MASGKSTVGRALAARLGIDFCDLDDLFVQRTGQQIADYFATAGEASFREKESELLTEVSARTNFVVSTGGGTPCREQNLKTMLNSGRVFFLDVPADELSRRLLPEKMLRPLIRNVKNEELELFVQSHLEERWYYYNQAHFKVMANQPPDKVVDAIVELLTKR
ncbi:MAG: shikimate kinase [Cryomorphaceae bacterium]|nr:MAG: shikimate kinase [Cryomorphaceae bacterium]